MRVLIILSFLSITWACADTKHVSQGDSATGDNGVEYEHRTLGKPLDIPIGRFTPCINEKVVYSEYYSDDLAGLELEIDTAPIIGGTMYGHAFKYYEYMKIGSRYYMFVSDYLDWSCFIPGKSMSSSDIYLDNSGPRVMAPLNEIF